MCSTISAQIGRGVFIWPSTFFDYGGIDNVISKMRENKITDIYLLVKGESGASLFPSDYTYKDLYYQLYKVTTNESKRERYLNLYKFMSDTSLARKIIKKAHQKGIKVHAWFMVSADRYFIQKHPGAEVVHIPKPDVSEFPYPVTDNSHVNLAFPSYKKYFFSLVRRTLTLPFDGLMLDKIRYTSLVYTWDNIHLSKALRNKINTDKVLESAYNTFYGKEDNKELFIYKYRDGDNDIRKWIEIKKADVEEYVKEASKIAKDNHLILSAAFMPEGAYDENFADVNYAQNYKDLSIYLDYIVIMAYAKAFNQPPTWLKMVIDNAKKRSSCKIWAAIQGYNGAEPEIVFEQIKNARISSPQGIAVFRFGGMNKKMWESFRSGFDINVKKIIKSQKKGVIYIGGGTIRNCWLKSASALLQSQDIIPLLLNEKYLTDYKNYSDMKFILLPGGGGSAEAKALGKTCLKNIDRFVASGGGYIGICAGAFLPIKGYFGNLTKWLQIINAQPIDVDHWNRGSGKVQLEIVQQHPIFRGIKSNKFYLKYYSGPILEPSDLELPPYKELAVFRTDFHENNATPGEMIGKSAVVESKYGKGRVILFSPHPELTPGMEKLLINAVHYITGDN